MAEPVDGGSTKTGYGAATMRKLGERLSRQESRNGSALPGEGEDVTNV
jgi:hypothetical protein